VLRPHQRVSIIADNVRAPRHPLPSILRSVELESTDCLDPAPEWTPEQRGQRSEDPTRAFDLFNAVRKGISIGGYTGQNGRI